MVYFAKSFTLTLSMIAVVLYLIGHLLKKGLVLRKNTSMGNMLIDSAKNDAIVVCFAVIVYLVLCEL